MQKNDTEIARFTVYRGIKSIKDLGRIQKINNNT